MNDPIQSSFDALYLANYKFLFTLAYRLTQNYHDAEDLVEESFIVYLVKSEDTHIENPRAYMVGILSKLYGNYIRSKERTTFPSDKIPEKPPSSDDEPYSLTDVLPAELLPWEREILLLRYSAGLSFAEIAQRLHIKESSCRSRHLRAKAHLKSLMQE